MKKLLAAALILGVTSLPALPQGFGRNERLDKMYEQQQKDLKQNEKEYNDTMKRLKSTEGAKIQNDPWRNVRPIENNRR